MSLLSDAAAAISKMLPLNTKNKNEVLYTQKLINALYKSPIVQKQKGKTFKLVEDGKWGPKTETAVKFTFGKIPSLQEMIAVQQQYSTIAAKAVAAQGSAGTGLINPKEKNALAEGADSLLNTDKAVVTASVSTGNGGLSELGKKAAKISNGTSPWLSQNLQALLLKQSNELAEQILKTKMLNEQQGNNQQSGYNAPPVVYDAPPPTGNNSTKYIFMGAAALAIVLILK